MDKAYAAYASYLMGEIHERTGEIEPPASGISSSSTSGRGPTKNCNRWWTTSGSAWPASGDSDFYPIGAFLRLVIHIFDFHPAADLEVRDTPGRGRLL